MDSNSSFSACSAVSSHVITSLTLSSICFFSSSSRASLNLSSLIWFFMLYAYDSRPFLASILSMAWASSSANCSASRTIRSMSSLLRRPLSLVMVMLAFLPDADLSSAVTWCWGDASELELAKKIVVLGAGALALVHLDEHTWLVVGVGGESLGLLGGDGGIAGNQSGHDSSSSLETHGKWGNVKQEDVLVTSGASSENVGLDSSTVCNSFIGVDGAAWLLAIEVVGDQLLHLGDTGGATNEHNLVH